MNESKIREYQDRLERLKTEKIRIEEKIKHTTKERDSILTEIKELGVTTKNIEKTIKDLEGRIEKGEEKLTKVLNNLEQEIEGNT